ncbi:hypothetical protein N7471_008906 [Penicillium samsonianum]|uniref:uncharacterized protein n=1 Tax=Penicillium samsonianum TaxID=1882272 RepID=UPI002546C180|nr:uncharacterized protein N7471_008906 [Penicillium samsonianum]KAJ6127689.1 hypothetical protein N7471_008906 [Penicillium samsonianum]
MTRWEKLGAADAWSDIIADWKDYRDKFDKDISDRFSSQILYFLGNSDGAKCHRIEEDSNCVQTRSYSEFEVETNNKTGATAVLIWNSIVAIHQVITISNPPRSLIALGVLTVGGKFFDDVLAGIPAMAAKTDASRDHHKSALNAILTSPITITTNLKGDSDVDDWTPEKQAEFSKYMGQSLKAWELTTMIADGRLLDGIPEDIPYPKKIKRKDKGIEALDA